MIEKLPFLILFLLNLLWRYKSRSIIDIFLNKPALLHNNMKAEEHQHTGILLDSMLSRFQVSLSNSSNAQAAPRSPGCASTPTASAHLSPATTIGLLQLQERGAHLLQLSFPPRSHFWPEELDDLRKQLHIQHVRN